jgi:hypothetical protein
MRVGIVLFIVLLFLAARPQLLDSFDTLTGRMLMLLGVVYLAGLNPLLGVTAAVVMTRVLDKSPKKDSWMPSADLLKVEELMKAKDSSSLPLLRSTMVPVNDVYEPYTIF